MGFLGILKFPAENEELSKISSFERFQYLKRTSKFTDPEFAPF